MDEGDEVTPGSRQSICSPVLFTRSTRAALPCSLMGDVVDERTVPGGPRWWPNEGAEPDPRWSLANERTLLAYTRTALALLVAGMAVSGSHTIAEVPRWLAAVGLPLIVLGAMVAGASRRRFLAAQRAMRTGQPLPAPSVAWFLPWGVAVSAVAGLTVAVLQLLL